MQCQFCSAEIPAGDQFCGSCGARAPVAPPPSATGADPSPSEAAPAQPPGQSVYGARPGDPQPQYGDQSAQGARSPGAPQQQWTQAYFDRDPNAVTAPAHEYGSFGSRLVAAIMDFIFAALLAAIPGIILLVIGILLVEANQEVPTTVFEADQQDEDTGIAAILGFAIGFVPVFYGYWYVATSLGGGWGKRIMGLRIIKQDTGARPGFGSGLIRVLVTTAFGWVPLVGSILQLVDHLAMLWDSDKQTWHDKAAGTIVVKA